VGAPKLYERRKPEPFGQNSTRPHCRELGPFQGSVRSDWLTARIVPRLSSSLRGEDVGARKGRVERRLGSMRCFALKNKQTWKRLVFWLFKKDALQRETARYSLLPLREKGWG
jgi:hypothetical protein